jgi:predicted transposase/invertase (TIGR01784 family)
MTEEQVKQQIQTPGVLRAFERAKLSAIPREIKESYETQEQQYAMYSQHTQDLIEKGKVEGLAEGANKKSIEIAQSMIQKGYTLEQVSELTGLTEEELKSKHSNQN